MPELKTPRTSKAAGGAAAKPDPAGPDQGGALPATTDPAGVTDQARKEQPKAPAGKPDAGAKKDRTQDGDPGINAHIIDGIPGREPKPEIDPDDPGINASVVS